MTFFCQRKEKRVGDKRKLVVFFKCHLQLLVLAYDYKAACKLFLNDT